MKDSTNCLNLDAARFNTEEGFDKRWHNDCCDDKKIQKFFDTYKVRFAIVADKIVGDIVLDVGCGVSMIPKFLYNNGSFYIGMDFSKEALNIMEKHFPNITTIKHDIRKDITLDDNSVDTVLALEVIEHLNNYKKLIKQMKKIAKYKVIVSVPINMKHNTHFRHIWPIPLCRNLFNDIKNTEVIASVSGRWRVVIWNKNKK